MNKGLMKEIANRKSQKQKYKGAILIDGNNNIIYDNRQKSKLDRCENKDYNKGYDEGRKDYADEVKRIIEKSNIFDKTKSYILERLKPK